MISLYLFNSLQPQTVMYNTVGPPLSQIGLVFTTDFKRELKFKYLNKQTY